MCSRFRPVFYCKTGNAARLMCVLFFLLCSLCRFLCFSLQSARPRGLRQLMQVRSALARGQGCVAIAPLFLPYFFSIPPFLSGGFLFSARYVEQLSGCLNQSANACGLYLSGYCSPSAAAHHSEQNHFFRLPFMPSTTPHAPTKSYGLPRVCAK